MYLPNGIYHALRTNKYKINNTKAHSFSHWMNCENCLSVRISSAVAKQQKAFSWLYLDNHHVRFLRFPKLGTDHYLFEGAGQFPKDIHAQQNTTGKKTSCEGSHVKKIGHVLYSSYFWCWKSSCTSYCHPKIPCTTKKKWEKKNHALENCPFPPPKKKKWFVFCHVVIMKGYSQFASEFGRPDGVEWIVQLIASEITNNITSLNAYT